MDATGRDSAPRHRGHAEGADPPICPEPDADVRGIRWHGEARAAQVEGRRADHHLPGTRVVRSLRSAERADRTGPGRGFGRRAEQDIRIHSLPSLPSAGSTSCPATSASSATAEEAGSSSSGSLTTASSAFASLTRAETSASFACGSSHSVRNPVRRHQHHQQEPARPDERTAKRPPLHDPGLLRPDPAAPQRADHPPPERQHLRPHPRRPQVRHLLHQSPRPDPHPTVPPANPRHHPGSSPHSTQSSR
jgi:hypothetical protein